VAPSGPVRSYRVDRRVDAARLNDERIGVLVKERDELIGWRQTVQAWLGRAASGSLDEQ